MTDKPTTTNGPLDKNMLGDPSIIATFADLATARAVRTALIAAGVDPSRVDLADLTEVQATALPADPGLFGRVRDALLPDDGETATRSAIHNNETILTLHPLPGEIDGALAILAAAEPQHFDADLERWRSAR